MKAYLEPLREIEEYCEIEKELFISKATVLTHICRLYQKLEISEYKSHGGSEYRVRAVLKFFEMQKNASYQPA